jgi:hypothetical protein
VDAPSVRPTGGEHDEIGREAGLACQREETELTVRLGILALLEAKPGKGDELGAFLMAGRAPAVAEATP